MWGIVGEYMGAPTVKALQSVLSGFGNNYAHLLRIRPWLQPRFDPNVQERMTNMCGKEESKIREQLSFAGTCSEYRQEDLITSTMRSLRFKLFSERLDSDSDSDSNTN